MSRKKKPRKKSKKPRKPQRSGAQARRSLPKNNGELVKAAHYSCCKEDCPGEFIGYPGPRNIDTLKPNVCPRCGSKYIKWLNYELFELDHG